MELAAIVAATAFAGLMVPVVRKSRRSPIGRADVAAYVNEQVAQVLAQRIGRAVHEVRRVLHGGGRPDIAKRIAETRWFATVQFQKVDRECVVRVVVSFPGAREVRSRRVDWDDVLPSVRRELMRGASVAVERPWQAPWTEQAERAEQAAA